MGNQKKGKQTAGESDESWDSDQIAQRPTSQPTLNIPRLLVVKSEEKDRQVLDLSPFAIKTAFNQSLGIRKVLKD